MGKIRHGLCFVLILLGSPALALDDNGGSMSHDAAVAVDPDDQLTYYVSSHGYSTFGARAMLWAFRADPICINAVDANDDPLDECVANDYCVEVQGGESNPVPCLDDGACANGFKCSPLKWVRVIHEAGNQESFSSPAVSIADETGQYVYVGSDSKILYAFDHLGIPQWKSQDLAGKIQAGPAIDPGADPADPDDDIVLVGSMFGGTLYAFAAGCGASVPARRLPIWQYEMPSGKRDLKFTPVVYPGSGLDRVFLGSNDKGLYGIDYDGCPSPVPCPAATPAMNCVTTPTPGIQFNESSTEQAHKYRVGGFVIGKCSVGGAPCETTADCASGSCGSYAFFANGADKIVRLNASCTTDNAGCWDAPLPTPAATARPEWERALTDSSRQHPVFAKSFPCPGPSPTVVVPATVYTTVRTESKLYGFNPESGAKILDFDSDDHISWSSAAVHPETGEVVFGSVSAARTLFKVNPCTIPVTGGVRTLASTETIPWEATKWFQNANQWRSTAVFARAAKDPEGEYTPPDYVFIADDQGIVYALEHKAPPNPCPECVIWCYDTRDPEVDTPETGVDPPHWDQFFHPDRGGSCAVGGARPACCPPL